MDAATIGKPLFTAKILLILLLHLLFGSGESSNCLPGHPFISGDYMLSLHTMIDGRGRLAGSYMSVYLTDDRERVAG